MRVLNKKGQNMAEYAILFALVIAAAIGMKTYVQRGVQGRIHDESDALVDKISKDAEVTAGWAEISKVDVNANKQYEPDYFSKQATTETVAGENKEVYTLEKKGTTSRDITKTTQQAKDDYEKRGYTGPADEK